jgi:Ca2+-binding EF-hand superfamily protein
MLKIFIHLYVVLGLFVCTQAEEAISIRVAKERIQVKDKNNDNQISFEEYIDETQINNELKKRFARQDLNVDNILTKDELVQYANKIWAQVSKDTPPWDSSIMAARQIQNEDKNKDGQISPDEYIQTHYSNMSKQVLKNFTKKDKNANGFIDLDEIL